MDILVGGIAACCACIWTHPLDVVKTRFQLQGELKDKYERHYRNMPHAGYQIWKHEGIRGLQNGLAPAFLVQFIMNGIRLGGFDIIQKRGWVSDEKGNIIFYKSFLGTGIIGMIGHLVANPFYLLKTQKMAKSAKAIAVGYQHNSMPMMKTFANIIQREGVMGLYRGTGAAMPRAFACTFSQLLGFAYGKEFVKKYDFIQQRPILATLGGAMIGGVAITIFTTPFDFVMVRLYNQGVDSNGKGLYYSGYFDCVYKIFKTEGISAFYKGIGAMYFRLGPHTLLTFIFWDICKDIYSKISNKN